MQLSAEQQLFCALSYLLDDIIQQLRSNPPYQNSAAVLEKRYEILIRGAIVAAGNTAPFQCTVKTFLNSTQLEENRRLGKMWGPIKSIPLDEDSRKMLEDFEALHENKIISVHGEIDKKSYRFEKWCHWLEEELNRLNGCDKGSKLRDAAVRLRDYFPDTSTTLKGLMEWRYEVGDLTISEVIKSHQSVLRLGRSPTSQKIYEKTFPMDDIEMTVNQDDLANIQFPVPNAAANPRP